MHVWPSYDTVIDYGTRWLPSSSTFNPWPQIGRLGAQPMHVPQDDMEMLLNTSMSPDDTAVAVGLLNQFMLRSQIVTAVYRLLNTCKLTTEIPLVCRLLSPRSRIRHPHHISTCLRIASLATETRRQLLLLLTRSPTTRYSQHTHNKLFLRTALFATT